MGERPDLNGLGIVVTRPSHQAEGLCRAIEEAGGTPIRFPTIEILPTPDAAPFGELAARLDRVDMMIFISANAVHFGLSALMMFRNLPDTVSIAAVGKATARALNEHSFEQVVVPESGYDSEALLALPQLQQMEGRQVVIVRGDGGREHLATTLTERGATVDYLEAYRRVCPRTDSVLLLKAWQEEQISVLVVTSNEGLQNLFDLVGPVGRDALLNTPLAVVSERMVKLAHELGFKRCIVAERASDEAIVAAIGSWRQDQQTH